MSQNQAALKRAKFANFLNNFKISYVWENKFVLYLLGQKRNNEDQPRLRASPTVSVELKFPVELNSFSDASRSANQRMKACS